VSVARVRGATVRYGSRVVFADLDLDVEEGEFLAVLGPNGAGKTTLLKMLLGLQQPAAGTVDIAGKPVGRANRDIGYVPQQASFDAGLPIRGRDLVQFGLDGHRFGFPVVSRRTRALVDVALRSVGAEHYADAPIGRLSGGEQQRLRIAQALVTDPKLLLCDEPLLSLDIRQQRVVSELINERRRSSKTAVLFVTHDINPVLPYVDRVLYFVDGRWDVGAPLEVLTTARLTSLYGADVEVMEVRGRIVVLGADEPGLTEAHAHHHHAHEGHSH
jgi:zinc/manganese transport system ATP-binding protein